MSSFIERLAKLKWKKWISPILMVVCIYYLAKLGFSDQPLLDKSTIIAGQGEVPKVEYEPTRNLVALVFIFIVFNAFLFLTLRQWARYFLNRKMVLSYLFFAIVPLLTNFFIFVAVIRAWFGISNTLIIEKTMELHKQELENFVQSIQTGIRGSETDASLSSPDLAERYIQSVIESSKNNELNSLRHLGSEVMTEVFVRSKVPGSTALLIPMYPPKASRRFFSENTREYDEIYPSWLPGSSWTDIVGRDGQLYIRHIDISDHSSEQIVVLASIPIDEKFLNRLREFQTVRIILANEDGYIISTDNDQGKWYVRFLLKPLSSSWDIVALNWLSGYYEDHGTITFEIDPFEIGRALGQTGSLHIFYDDQKKSSFSFIIGVALFLIVGVLIAVVFGFYLVRYITRSLNILAVGNEKVGQGELSYRLPYIGKDQLGAMGRSFNSMVSSIESLMTQVLEQEKYQEELRIARDIQMSLLPDLSKLKWCSNIAATCIPAREVGGDYYEVLRVETGEIGVFIADVSGKGTSAAFYMAELKGVLIALKHLWRDPEALLLGMNDILEPALASNVFISAAYLLIDPQEKTGKLVRAGHCPSFHVKEDGIIHDLMPPGIALGIAKNHVFGKVLKVAEFPMEETDKIILYTDGLDEMTNCNEMYGTHKLRGILSKNGNLGVVELKDAILHDVLDFLSSETQNDDLTLVVAGLPLSAETCSPDGALKSELPAH